MVSSPALLGDLPAWHLHLDTWLVVALLAGLWVTAVVRERRRRGPGGQPAVSRRQLTSFAAGVVVLWMASDWPVHDIAEGYLYSVHMVQHLMLTLLASLLLVAGTPGWMAERILRGRLLRLVRGLSRPVLNLVQLNLVLVLSHWPLVVDATLEYHPLHFVAHAVLLASAVIMWLPIASQTPAIPRFTPPGQMVYLFMQTILPTVPASFLTFGTSPLYPRYATFPRLWEISVITDQQVAGLVMKIGGGLFLWLVIAAVFFKWYGREEGNQARSARPDPGGEVTPKVLTGNRDPAELVDWADLERDLADLDAQHRPPG